MYSINPDTVVLDFCPIFFPLLSLSPLFILENAHYSVVLIELRPRIFISFLVVFAEESDGTRETDLARLEKNFEKDETNSNAN